MPNETESVTLTQTEPDGTVTTIEITQTKPEEAGNEQSIVEEIIEAIFDSEAADTTTENAETAVETDFIVTDDEPGEIVFESSETAQPSIFDNAETPEPVAFESSESNSPTDYEPEIILPVNYESGTVDFVPDAYDVSFVPTNDSGTVETTDSTADASESAEQTEQQAQADAAREAQEAANDFVAAGDYEAAAEAREAAENAAWEAGDDSMLEGSSAAELENAAWEQDQADYYQQLQDEYTAAGNYEAAQEAADKVVEHTGNADYYGGGDDHTAQARNEEYQLGNAVWEEGNAEWYAQNAQEFAEQGNFDAAADYAESAGEHQVQADAYADSTLDGSTYDASSQVETGGSYDAGAVDYSAATDYSSYDAGGADFSTVDTSTDYSTE
jgi:hypothetical protein